MPNQNLVNLINILEKQKEFYQALLSLAKEKQPLLVKGDLTSIEAITNKEQKLIVQLGKLEEARGVIHKTVAEEFGLSLEECTLTKLKEVSNDDLGLKLEKVGQDLSQVLIELRQINHTNNDLVEQSLQYIDFMVNIISTVGDAPEYPERDGKANVNKGSRLFDKMV